jgi:hypothetical protein
MTRETETSGLGARYAEVLRAGAGTTTSRFTVTSFEPNRLVGFTSVSGTTGIYAFTARGDTTEVSFTVRPTPTGIRSTVGALVRKRALRRHIEGELEQLRLLLEDGPTRVEPGHERFEPPPSGR